MLPEGFFNDIVTIHIINIGLSVICYKNSVFFSFLSQKVYKESFLVKLGKLQKSLFLIKSNFSDHINMLLLTKSSFLSQYE